MRKRNLSRSPSAPVFDCLWSERIIASDREAVKKNLRTAASCFFPGNRYYIVWMTFIQEVFLHDKDRFPGA